MVGATYLAGTKLAFFPELPVHLMVFAVAATILGGIGNVFAAGIAAVFISVLQQASVLVIEARWQPLIVFGILFAAILFFPKGVRWKAKRISRGPAAGLRAIHRRPEPWSSSPPACSWSPST